jgi:type I restriction enzyme S subunit
MSSSRAGWMRVRFGDVVRLVRDRVDPMTSGLSRYVAGEHMDTDDLHIRRWGEVGGGYLGPAFHMRFKPGHVLYGSRRTYLRKVAVADFEGICANTTFVLEPADTAVLMPRFLPFVMQAEAFHGHSIKQSKGSVNPYINFSDVAWYEFDLPPIDEQHRITNLLRNVDHAIEETTGLLLAAEKLFRQYIELFRGRPSVASVALKTLCSDDKGVAVGPFGSLLHRQDYCSDEDGVPVVMPADMVDGRINHSTVARVTRLKAAEMTAYSLRPGDLLLPRRGELDRRARVHESDCPALCGTGSIRIRVRDPLDSWRVFYALSASGTIRFLEERSQGSIMPSIGAKTVAEIPVAVMNNEHRDLAVRRANSLEKLAVEATNRLAGLRWLRKKAITFG